MNTDTQFDAQRRMLIERSIIKKYRRELWSRFTKAVKDYKIAVVPGTAFMINETDNTTSFRLNFSTPTDEQIVKGIEILGRMTKEMFD